MGLSKLPANYWDERAKMGRPKNIKNPMTLWKLACQYFKWVTETPVILKEVLRGGDRAGEIIEVETARPFTWNGFSDYLWAQGIVSDLDDYRKNTDGRYSEFRPVLARIGAVMKDQKFTGAAVGIFKEGIVKAELYGDAERIAAAEREGEEDKQIIINIRK